MSELATARKKCDDLLTPIVKLVHPICECCNSRPTVDGDHWIEKGRSSYLRYELKNIVALCRECHNMKHQKYGAKVDVKAVMIRKRGKAWDTWLNKVKDTYVKTDIGHYQANYIVLENIYRALNK